MAKRVSFKIGTLFAFALMITVLLSSTKAFAEDTKYVTVTVPQNIACPDYVIGNVMQSISNSTYSYDDGAYKGTLSYAGYSDFASSVYATYPTVTIYRYTFNVHYAGTVTKYEIPATKYVTASRHYDITAPLSAVESIRQSMANSTYAFDDGSYKGTLTYTGISNWSQSYYTEYPGVVLYHISFDVNYAGTVTKY